MRLLTLCVSVLTAGIYWWGSSPRIVNGWQAAKAVCFDETQEDSARIEDCSRIYAAGGAWIGNALDEKLSIYAKSKNFEDGRRTAKLPIDRGFTAPRWTLWLAYFNEKLGIDQPRLNEQIENIKHHPRFMKELRTVWSQVNDKPYVMAQLAILEKEYGQELWAQRQRGWLLGWYENVEDSFEVFTNLISERPDDWAIFSDFGDVCITYHAQCPRLGLVSDQNKIKYTCQSALSSLIETEEDQARFHALEPRLNIPVIDIYSIDELAWIQAQFDYAVEIYNWDEQANHNNARRLLALNKLGDCFEIPAFNDVDEFADIFHLVEKSKTTFPPIMRENLNELAYYMLSQRQP